MLRKIRSFISMVLIIALCLQITPFAANVTQFSDVPSNHWAYEGITFVISKGYMGETQDGLFEPDSIASRGMIITALYRLAGEPPVVATNKPFSDVELGIWYSNPIIWAKDTGIIDGHEDGTFRPTDNMPREQIALIMYRYAQTLNYDTSDANSDFDKFPDFHDTPIGCKPAMKWAIKKDMLIGRADNNLHPNAAATRAELATCLCRFVTNNRTITSITIEGAKTVTTEWTGTLSHSLTPALSNRVHYANANLKWSSSDPYIATVDENTGIITALDVGITEITVKTVQGNHVATCMLEIYSEDPFHDSNIKSIEVRKWDSVKTTNGLAFSKVEYVTVVTESFIDDKTYFSAFPIDDSNQIETFEVNDFLITRLRNLEDEYSKEWTHDLATESFHQAKTYVDQFVESGKLSEESAAYYGIWAFNGNSILQVGHKLSLSYSKATLVYSGLSYSFSRIMAIRASYLPTGSVTYYNSNLYQSAVASQKAIANISDDLAVQLGKTDLTVFSDARRSWRASELRASLIYTKTAGYKYNQSYALVNGSRVEVPYGQANSQRPDFFNPITNDLIEIKNYTITTTEGRNRLANNIATQYNQRQEMFPDANITFLVDVYGQSYTQNMLDDIIARVQTKLGHNNCNIDFLID